MVEVFSSCVVLEPGRSMSMPVPAIILSEITTKNTSRNIMMSIIGMTSTRGRCDVEVAGAVAAHQLALPALIGGDLARHALRCTGTPWCVEPPP